MNTPDQPIEEKELLVAKQGGAGNRRVRKRRMRKPKETMYAIELHRRTMRIRLMMALAVLVLAAAIAVLVAWYPSTPGFQSRLNQMMLNSTGAEIKMKNVVLAPFHASADRLEAQWPEGNFLSTLQAENITANVLPQRYFSRTYGGDEIDATYGKLTVRFPDPEALAMVMDGASGKSRVRFGRIGIPKFDVEFGDFNSDMGAMIRDTEAAFYPSGPGGVPRAMLFAGTFHAPFWPHILIERAIIDFPGDHTQITSIRLRDRLPDRNHDLLAGSGDVSGVVSHDPAEASLLNLVLDGFQIQALIGEEAGRFFIGRVDTTASDGAGVIRISQQEGLQMRAQLVASPRSQLTFSHFPFLAFLARSVDDRSFLNPMFDEAPSMVLIRDGADMLFDEINFTAKNRMAIRGAISITAEDVIEGELEVGVASTVIDVAIARRLDGMFSPEREDFRWISLKIGGTTRAPTDNFNELFIEAPNPKVEIPPTLPPAPAPPPVPDPDPAPTPRPEDPPTVLPPLLDLDEQ